jgi:uncharacterized protein (DUF697 family)
MIHDMDRTQMGFGQEAEGFNFPTGETFNETEQLNLAAELMEVASEQEFEAFMGDLFSKAANAVGGFISSPTGQALGGVLKGVAKQLLPVAGSALGGRFGGSAGAAIGGQLGQQAADLFEAESGEQEWEASNTFIKLATDAAKIAAQAPQSANPMAVAKQAVIDAAKVHAPQLLKTASNGGSASGGASASGGSLSSGMAASAPHSGRWIRHGKRIILLGV